MLKTIICIGCDSGRVAAQSRVLQNAGYVVLWASNLEQTLCLLNQRAVDLLILDQTSDQSNRLLAAVLDRNHRTPVVLMYSVDEDRSIRADTYFNLADPPAALLDAVASIVERESTQQPCASIVECSGIGHFSPTACSSL